MSNEMPQNQPVNLFGWNQRGPMETYRLLTMLIKGNDFKFLCETRNNTILLIAPYKYQQKIHAATPVLQLSDNGGEVNVMWVNRDETLVSIPSTWNGANLNAETMHYRIMSALDGDRIEWHRIEEHIEVELLGKAS